MSTLLSDLDDVWREERPRLVGALARRFGDLGLAEDAVQEAFEAAAVRWPIDGSPDRPGAWLHTTAYRKAVGMMRRRRPTSALEEANGDTDREDGRPDVADVAIAGLALDDMAIGGVTERGGADGPSDVRAMDDDFLGLLLTCCHPALDSEARIALTLRHVCGLSAEEIAAAFVVSDAAMTKRLVRARSKIKQAGISFELPDREVLDDRLGDVRTVLYVVFTEGHLSAVGDDAIRVDLCDEAIWLTRQLVRLRPADDESRGLLALFLFQHSRRAERLSEAGELVKLADQRRDQWDYGAIDEARSLLADPDVTTLGPYRVEAAIAALHVADGGTDWARIADLYGVLARLAPSPIVDVNRALAVSHADGPPAGLAILQPVLDSGRVDAYPPAHAVHAALLERIGDTRAAREAWLRAAALSSGPARRAAMQREADRLDGSGHTVPGTV